MLKYAVEKFTICEDFFVMTIMAERGKLLMKKFYILIEYYILSDVVIGVKKF